MISTKNAKRPRPGQTVTYEDDGRAELEFVDAEGVIHTIYIDPKYIIAKNKGRPTGRPKTVN